jgi:hypothetical protein
LKCSFYQKKIHYLGHIISREGIVVDPEKVEAIMECPKPTNVQEVHIFRFSGLLSTFHQRFFKHSKSDHRVTEEENKIVYAEKCVETFHKHKELLTKITILN